MQIRVRGWIDISTAGIGRDSVNGLFAAGLHGADKGIPDEQYAIAGLFCCKASRPGTGSAVPADMDFFPLITEMLQQKSLQQRMS